MQLKIRRPFEGDYPVSFAFGQAPDWYVSKAGYPHNGVDYPLPNGTPVVACDRGTVSEVDNHPSGWGKFVRIQHTWGMSHYAHLAEVEVKIGQEVNTGDKIGKSDTTGWATGAHLHFGIKVNGVQNREMKDWVDPLPYFVPQEVMTANEPKLHNEKTVVRCPTCKAVFTIERGLKEYE